MNHYITNLETGKLELHFEKSAYMAMSEAQKKDIKSNFLWSNYAGGWVSRAKSPNLWRAENVAKSLGLTNEGTTGEKLTFAEQVEREQERAADRAERMAERASKAETESTHAYEKANNILSFIPPGQPILIGHHSERRHRRDLEKADNSMRKSIELADKAKHYEERAANAEYTAEGAKFKNRVYMSNKLAELQAREAKILRYLEGKFYAHSEPKEISAEYSEKLNANLSDVREQMEFFIGKLNEMNLWTPQRLMEVNAGYVMRRGTWFPIKSINAKSVTILNWIAAQHTWKCTFAEIQDVKPIGGMVVLDRDGNEVKPTIKYKQTNAA